MSIQELREQRAAKAKAVGELVAKKKWDKVKDQPLYDAGMLEIDDIDLQIKNIVDYTEKLAEEAMDGMLIEAGDRALRNKKSPGLKLYTKWLAGGDTALSRDEWAIHNTLSVNTPSQGGYTVETEIVKVILDALQQFGGMRAVSTVLQTAMGNPMSFPTSTGVTEVGEWVTENATATALDPVVGTISLPVFKVSSKVVAIPFELLQDSNVDFEAFVRMRLATRLGRITNTGYTVGTGTGQPTGLVTAATTGVIAANATSQVLTITYNSLINLIHSVDPAYRGPNCKFMMHDFSLRQIRQITDTQNRPIFVPGYTLGISGAGLSAPDSIAGYPVITNQDMPQMAASAKSIAFGDMSYYYIRDVMALEMFRFTDSVYTKLGQVGFLAWMRSGGNLIDIGGAVKLFANAAS